MTDTDLAYIKLLHAPISNSDLYFIEDLQEKIDKHSEKIIRFLFGKHSVRYVQTNYVKKSGTVYINYTPHREDEQFNFHIDNYIGFDFKNKKAWPSRKYAAKELRRKRREKTEVKQSNEIRLFIQEAKKNKEIMDFIKSKVSSRGYEVKDAI